MSEGETSKPKVSGTQLIGGVLTAVTAAVLLSTLGSIGTLAGAALSSVVYTVGGSVYTHYVEAGKKRVQRAAEAARDRARGMPTRTSAATTRRDQNAASREDVGAETSTSDLSSAAEATPERGSWKESLRAVPWKRVGALTAGLFVVAMAIIVSFELTAGRSVASFTGGADADGPRTSISFKKGASDDGNRKGDGDADYLGSDSEDADNQGDRDDPAWEDRDKGQDEAPQDEGQQPDQQPDQQGGDQGGQDQGGGGGDQGGGGGDQDSGGDE